MKRRHFLAHTINGMLGAGLLTFLYTWQIEPFWLEFVHKKMPIQNLPAHLIGKTLMQISDIHVGNKFDHTYIIKSFKSAQKFNPDFVVYTGDYISFESNEQFDQLQEVLKYVVTGKIATLGILGNHDYGDAWSDQHVATKVSYYLRKVKIELLQNQQKEIDGLNFIGLDDYWGLNFNPEKVMRHFDEQKANIVLCHNPDVCDLDIWHNYKGWILAGHTHGGQCKPPFLPPPLLPVKNKKYAAGEIDLRDGRTLYINRALGHLHQVRFNVRPEITVFTLEQKKCDILN